VGNHIEKQQANISASWKPLFPTEYQLYKKLSISIRESTE